MRKVRYQKIELTEEDKLKMKAQENQTLEPSDDAKHPRLEQGDEANNQTLESTDNTKHQRLKPAEVVKHQSKAEKREETEKMPSEKRRPAKISHLLNKTRVSSVLQGNGNKKKTVSISDENEVIEIDNTPQNTHQPQPAKTVHISEISEPDACKTQ